MVYRPVSVSNIQLACCSWHRRQYLRSYWSIFSCTFVLSYSIVVDLFVTLKRFTISLATFFCLSKMVIVIPA